MSKTKNKHGALWWALIGWWWLPIKWLCIKFPTFILHKIFIKAKSNKVSAPTKTNAPSPIKSNIKIYHATGMQYRLENLLSLGTKNLDYLKSTKALIHDGLIDVRIYEYEFYTTKTELVPEPDNPHDPQAIKVIVDGVHIAYIKAGSCAHLLNALREERIEGIKCEIGGGNYKYLCEEFDEDGETSYTLDKASTEYSARLFIAEKP